VLGRQFISQWLKLFSFGLKVMIQFLVQLRLAEECRAETGLRPLSSDDIARRRDALHKVVMTCTPKIQKLLPPGAELFPLESLGGIVVAIPFGDQALCLQEQIRAACGDHVVGFGTDAEIEMLQTSH
jgi:hypothetical protein